ncbi:hypothetical protein M8C21_026609, partial [Ambrosia artemisiifolia]
TIWNEDETVHGSFIYHNVLDSRFDPLYSLKDYAITSTSLKGLPRGIIEAKSDLELKPLWPTSSSKSKGDVFSTHNLLAVPVGLKQKRNVNTIVQKVDGWRDLNWHDKVIHIVAQNQTKWFAKRFLHPSAVPIYDYIFLWDEDLGVQHFNPRRYLNIVKAEGFEISQPALDPNSTEIHHRITIRKRTNKFHRRVYDSRGSVKCSDDSEGPPCSGFVEGMAPVFSRAAWHCAWHLIQNDLVHGWGMDMKLGYCAQTSDHVDLSKIRRQSTTELQIFRKRWEKAVKEDTWWIDSLKI